MRRALTLVELLVVISIIALLIGLLLPALGRARQTARHSMALSHMRQMMAGYAQYYLDHNGQVLWGYTPTKIAGVDIEVTDRRTGLTFGIPVADRYPWRLAPYVGDIWAILHHHTDPPPLPDASDTPAAAFAKAYTLSLNPSFGLNTCYVGGSTGVWEGFVTDMAGLDHPNRGRHVVFRDAEVRRASSLIVFGESVARNITFTEGPTAGMHFLTPPYAKGHHWQDAGNDFELLNLVSNIGLPKGRFSHGAVTGFFDAHAAAQSPADLHDMRRWANFANGPDDDF